MPRPLTRPEFRDALEKGLGRAVVHARVHGLAGFEPEILGAMRRRLAYDLQCEPGRGVWLWSVIRAAKSEPRFRQAVLRGLRRNLEQYATVQLCELAGCYASAGDSEIKEGLYDLFERGLARDEILGDDEILAADGLAGFVRMAQTFGRCVRAEKKVPDWGAGSIFTSARELLGARKLRGSLRRKDDDLDSFKKELAVQLSRRKPWRRPKRPAWSEVRRQIEDGGSYNSFLARRFGRGASLRERQVALDFSIQQKDPKRTAAALNVFSTALLPHYDSQLKIFALSRDRRLRLRAMAALSTLSHPEVRRLALSSLHHPRLLTSGAVELFAKNYRDEDGIPIMRAISTLRSKDALHPAVLDLCDVAGRKCPSSLVPAVVKACLASPCGLCRCGLFKSLCRAKAAPSWMVREFRFDTDEDIRAAALRSFKRSHQG